MADSILDNPVFFELLQQYVQESERVLRREVAAQGLIISGDMLSSIKAGAMVRGQGFIEGHVMFEQILRLKDMRQLNFTHMPPFRAMVKFVETVGPDAFPRVPGFKDGQRSSSYTINVERIAAGVMRKFKREPNVKRGYRGIYNDPVKTYVLPAFFNDLRQHAGATALSQLRLQFKD